MRVLIVEDTAIGELMAEKLEQNFGYQVTWVCDPLQARMCKESFDVVVVDLLFEKLNQEFSYRCRAGQVDLQRDQLLISGLTTVEDVIQSGARIGIVIWSTAEANRSLHLLYAHEVLGVRVFCSKSYGRSNVDLLNTAIQHAAAGYPFIEAEMRYHVSSRQRRLKNILLEPPRHRAIWRAVASGARTRPEIQAAVFFDPKNVLPELGHAIAELAPAVSMGPPLNEVNSYASRNWEFFLDDAVRRRFP